LTYKYGEEWLWNNKIEFNNHEFILITKSTNDIKDEMQKKFNTKPNINSKHKQQIANLTIKNKVIAELNFGFWKALITDRCYQTRIFNCCARHIFKNAEKTERDVAVVRDIVPRINLFRNRVFHHEPIWNDRQIYSKYNDVYRLIKWICPNTGTWIKSSDRFEEVYQNAKEKLQALGECS
jgi:hypothetical protein